MVVFLLSCYFLEEVHGTFSSSGFDNKKSLSLDKINRNRSGNFHAQILWSEAVLKTKPPLTHGLSTPMNPMNPYEQRGDIHRTQFSRCSPSCFFSPSNCQTSWLRGSSTPQPMSHPATRRIARSDRTIKRDDKPMAERRMVESQALKSTPNNPRKVLDCKYPSSKTTVIIS